MSDELRLLKAYIPEHIREAVMARRGEGSFSASSLSGPGLSSDTLPTVAGTLNSPSSPATAAHRTFDDDAVTAETMMADDEGLNRQHECDNADDYADNKGSFDDNHADASAANESSMMSPQVINESASGRRRLWRQGDIY